MVMINNDKEVALLTKRLHSKTLFSVPIIIK